MRKWDRLRQKLFITSLVVCRVRHRLITAFPMTAVASLWWKRILHTSLFRCSNFWWWRALLELLCSCTSEMRDCFSCSVSKASELVHVATRPWDMLEMVMRSKSSYDYKHENKSKIRQGSLQCTYHSTLHAPKNMSIFFSPSFCLSFKYTTLFSSKFVAGFFFRSLIKFCSNWEIWNAHYIRYCSHKRPQLSDETTISNGY